jgi:hypothetical protein
MLWCGEDDGKTWVNIPSIAIAFIRHIVYLSAIKGFSSLILI